MAKRILLLVLLSVVYISLLTLLFENFINKPSSTLLSIAGVILFIGISYFFVQLVFKTLQKRF